MTSVERHGPTNASGRRQADRLAWSGETFQLSAAPVWVRRVVVGLTVAQGNVA